MLRHRIKSLLRRFGYDVVQYVDTPQRPFDVLEYIVSAHLLKSPRFFFVQIGANDGVTDDPIHKLVTRYKLPGLLVEPLPDVFQRLRMNYEGCLGLSFEQCAIAEHDGKTQIFRIHPSAPVSVWFQGFSSLRRTHLSGTNLGTERLRSYIVEETVPCLTLGTLLKRHNVNDITLLQVDTEGLDCDIVRMAIQEGLRPAIINYEFVHASPVERAACKRMLAQAGYGFIDVGMDTLAERQSGGSEVGVLRR